MTKDAGMTTAAETGDSETSSRTSTLVAAAVVLVAIVAVLFEPAKRLLTMAFG
jgi:hypothetical protein